MKSAPAPSVGRCARIVALARLFHAPSAVRRPPFTAPVVALLALLAASISDADEAQRIVSLAPNVTELVFAAGAGERLVGAVDHSDFPAAARAIPRIGDAFRVDLERLLALRPDLVLAWESGTSPALIERLERLGLNVVVLSTRRIDDIPAALRQIAAMTGGGAAAERNASTFERRIAALRERYAHRANIRVFMQVNDRPIYTVNGAHIISEVLALCGGLNVFAELNQLAPAIGVEAVLAADPEVILAADRGVPDALAQWRRWRHLQAVRADNVLLVDSDTLTRATPRLAEGAEQVCRLLDDARTRSGA